MTETQSPTRVKKEAPASEPAKRSQTKSFVFSAQFSAIAVLVAVGVGFLLFSGSDDPKSEGRGDRRVNAAAPKGAATYAGVYEIDWKQMRSVIDKGGAEADGFERDLLRRQGEMELRLTVRADKTWLLVMGERSDERWRTRRASGRWREISSGRVELTAELMNGEKPSKDQERMQLVRRPGWWAIDSEGYRLAVKRR